jgi:hypothetical protein
LLHLTQNVKGVRRVVEPRFAHLMLRFKSELVVDRPKFCRVLGQILFHFGKWQDDLLVLNHVASFIELVTSQDGSNHLRLVSGMKLTAS